MLTNEIEHYIATVELLKLDKPKQKITIFMFCSDMSELLIVTDCHGLLKKYTKFNKI
jgi:hypothetical protein